MCWLHTLSLSFDTSYELLRVRRQPWPPDVDRAQRGHIQFTPHTFLQPRLSPHFRLSFIARSLSPPRPTLLLAHRLCVVRLCVSLPTATTSTANLRTATNLVSSQGCRHRLPEPPASFFRLFLFHPSIFCRVYPFFSFFRPATAGERAEGTRDCGGTWPLHCIFHLVLEVLPQSSSFRWTIARQIDEIER